MTSIVKFLQREPAVIIALADAILVVAVTFGLPLKPEQKGALDALLAVVAGILIRSQVSPVAAVKP